MSKTIKEIWKPCPLIEFCEKYDISNLGNVRNKQNKILKHGMRSGYKSFGLTNGNIKKAAKLHILVAKAFVPINHNIDPNKKKIVNHINGDKMDCRAVNLEWTTNSGNVQHAIDTNLIKVNKTAVMCYDPETENPYIYNSILEASKDTGVSDATICKACSGKLKSAGGYNWIYLEENKNNQSDIDLSKFKQIDKFPNYLINNKGKIYSLSYKRFMKYQNHQTGSQMIQLYNTQQPKDFLVHRLVAQYFLKKDKPKYNSIYHIDGDKTNNFLSNLEWIFVPGVEQLESKYNTPYYNPKTAIKKPKRKSVNSGPKDLLTANPKNLSKKQREERKKLLAKQLGSNTNKEIIEI